MSGKAPGGQPEEYSVVVRGGAVGLCLNEFAWISRTASHGALDGEEQW